MEIIIGIMIGVIIILILGKFNHYYKEWKKRMDRMEEMAHERYHSIMNDLMDMQENIIRFENKLKDIKTDNDKIKMLEEELKFEKKSNGLNFQKVIKDIIRIKEHMTYVSQSKEK
jgi:uncharacterized membrane protein YgaE (UPF0421/DUF939 family)